MKKRLEWLDCKATQGMFPNEVAIIVTTADSGAISLFVPRLDTLVRLQNGGNVAEINGTHMAALLRVHLLEQDERYGLVALPGESLEGSRVAKVEKNLLRVA